MSVADIKVLEKNGNDAVEKLRKAKFSKGLPFMINSKALPAKQCYLEFVDGRILLVELTSIEDQDFTEIRQLSVDEASAVREVHGFMY